MKKLLLFAILASSLLACQDRTTETIAGKFLIHILPQPKEIDLSSNAIVLSNKSKLYSPDPSLQPLLGLAQNEIEHLTGKRIEITTSQEVGADINFHLEPNLGPEEYTLRTTQSVEIHGGSYAAVAAGKNTLLQLLSTLDQKIVIPQISLRDFPDASFRGLLIDLARQWHNLDQVKELIDLAAFYKCNFVQLHFTDYQSFTLPSTHFPKLSTPDRHYSFEDLRELEAYASLRGIAIIPELEVPGHSSPFVKMYPEIFAIEDTASNPWIVNMGREEIYPALDSIIGELAEIFQTSPYFHIGGDEAIFNQLDQDPDVQAYMATHGLGTDVHELYRHFLVRMNEIVKSHGKKMCVWEGFGPEGQVKMPKDLIVFEFETNRYLPDQLIKDGYTVVNTSWKPLYVVNQKKWEPKTIYDWNMWRWENWWPNAPSFKPIQVEQSDLVIGAQMCAWEQAALVEFPSLRKRLPVFIERIWNTEKKVSYDQFMLLLEQTDQKLTQLTGNDSQDSLLVGYNFVKPED
ncbi:MAG: family 20 glycosylhydrolase [Bacteroidota bacterium]